MSVEDSEIPKQDDETDYVELLLGALLISLNGKREEFLSMIEKGTGDSDGSMKKVNILDKEILKLEKQLAEHRIAQREKQGNSGTEKK